MSQRPGKGKREKPFAAIEIGTVTSEHWELLIRSEAHVYNTLKTFYRGKKEAFSASFDELKKRTRIKHGHTLDKSIQGLEMKGWIKVTRYAKHGKCRGLRVKPNEYELTFQHDYCRW